VCVEPSAQVSLRRLRLATFDDDLGSLMALKPLEISMPWRGLIMGEPERLLESASAGVMTKVHFSDRSVAYLFGDLWVVTNGLAEKSEAADFVVALMKRTS